MLMKKLSILMTGIAGLLWLATTSPALAGDKEVSVSGEAKCAKCSMKEGDKCQTVIQTEAKNGKQETYYLADNQAAKDFHHDVCTGSKKVTATGTVKEVNGKKELTVTKIAAAK